MSSPSTEWREVVAADEPERHARQAETVTRIQAAQSARTGPGRAFHRKPVLGLTADFVVADGLPDYARHGLFASPGTYPCRVRLSNGATRPQKDRTGDIRGFAFSVEVPEAPGALGTPTRAQDFLLVNRPGFGFPTSVEFMAVVESLSRGPLALLWHFVSTYGLFDGFARIKALQANAEAPFDGFTSSPFFTAVPFRCGPYAARARLQAATEGAAPSRDDWAADVRARLANGPLRFPFQLQFFVDEATTPIEDATAPWPEEAAPFVTVGELVLHGPAPEGEAAAALSASVEAAAFDPWKALAEHQPLGEVMRARKVAYYASVKGR